MKYLALLLISLPAFGQFGAASRILSGTGAPVAAQCTVENNVGLVWARKDGADAGTTFYVCGATGVGTYGWELRGGAPGGGAALSTVGSVPFVTSGGVLGQNTNFRFFAGTGNLVVGTTTDDGVNRLQVAGSVYTTGPLRVDNNDGFIGNLTTGTFLNIGSLGDANNVWVDARGTGANVGMNFRTKGSGLFSWFNTTAGVSLMTLSNAGELSVRNQTPTTGSTSLVVRAGAGQGTTNLTTWQNAAGSSLAAIVSDGSAYFQRYFDSGGTIFNLNATALDVRSAYLFRFSSTTVESGTKDLSLSRASANTLQVGDGGANSNGTIVARIHTWANGTEGTCDATLRGQVVMVQGGAGVADTFRICRKDAANAYAWTALY
ncbi:MAG: hypothetical protein INH43_18830 [Acidobacteriaceae bacterium]|nr:hypothetical protein [Acidobacteriaceae bacterium]